MQEDVFSFGEMMVLDCCCPLGEKLAVCCCPTSSRTIFGISVGDFEQRLKYHLKY